MVNKQIIVGNLGKDPDVRFTSGGQATCSLSVAATEKWRNKDGEAKEHTEWFRVVVWGKQAEHCGQYLAKGSKVYVEGPTRTREYVDKHGDTKSITEVAARDIKFLSPRDGTQRQAAPASNGAPADMPPDDDIPF